MYSLIHNNKIQVGPRNWAYSFFKRYLENNNLDYSNLPISDPRESVIDNDWKILKTNIVEPSYNFLFEQLSGPFLTINENDVSGYYNVIDLPVEIVKSNLKAVVASNRYDVEIQGVDFTFSDNTIVNLYTDREDRNVYLDAMLVMSDTDVITFKFKNSIFKNVTKTDLQAIVGIGSQYIAEAFGWEGLKVNEIETAESISALKLIELRHPIQIET